MHKIIFLVLVSSFFQAQQYKVGDNISIQDQNKSFSVCNGYANYSLGSSWSLSEYNGDLNGGNYKVLMLDIVATW